MCKPFVDILVTRFSAVSLDLPKNDILSEMDILEEQFGELRDEVYESVKTQPVDTFKVRLTAFKVKDREHHMDYVKEIIYKKDNVSDIWVALNDYLNFLNYEILQHILSKFKSNVLQKRMDKYLALSSDEHVCVTSLNAGLYGEKNLQ